MADDQRPALVRGRGGVRRSQQLGTFINAVIRAIRLSGVIGMDAHRAAALADSRRFNYEQIYLRGPSRHRAVSVAAVLRARGVLCRAPSAHPRRRRARWRDGE